MPSITFGISESKFEEFKEAFLLYCPVPIDSETDEPIMPENQWIKEWGRRMYYDAYRQGRHAARDLEHPFTQDGDILT